MGYARYSCPWQLSVTYLRYFLDDCTSCGGKYLQRMLKVCGLSRIELKYMRVSLDDSVDKKNAATLMSAAFFESSDQFL